MFLIYVLNFPTYMFDSEHKYAIDYGTLIALSDACSAPYLSLLLHVSYDFWLHSFGYTLIFFTG